jgi:hypothetical protein
MEVRVLSPAHWKERLAAGMKEPGRLFHRFEAGGSSPLLGTLDFLYKMVI